MAIKTAATAELRFNGTAIAKVRDVSLTISRDALDTTGIGQRDRAGLSRDLIDPFAEQPHHHGRDDHVARDPERQNPAVLVDQRWKARKAAAAGAISLW